MTLGPLDRAIVSHEVTVMLRTVSEPLRTRTWPFVRLSHSLTGNAIDDREATGVRTRSGASGVVATNTVRTAGTAIDVDGASIEDTQRDLNVVSG